MDPRAFLEQARSAGLTLAVRGDALTVSPAGRLTDAQREFIRAHRPALLLALNHVPEPEPVLPAAVEPPPGESDSAPVLPPPWAEIRRWIQRGWRAEFSVPDSTGRQRITWIPPGQWSRAEAQHGEPAPMAYPEPAHAPTGATEARAAMSGPVRCGDCAHFRPDPIGDGTGIGSCGAGVPARAGWPARYPNAERHCRDFTASTSTSEAAP